MIDEGCKVIFATSFGYQDYVVKMAKEFPNIQFFHATGYMTSANLSQYNGRLYQARFLAGIAAGKRTKTGKIGTFGGAKIPTVTIFMVGFQKGMEAYNAKHGTSVTLVGWDNATGEGVFTGDFQDQVKGKEATQSLFDEGADIFMPVGGQIGIPGFEVARERGGYGIWVDTDGYVSLSGVQDVILTSVMKVMDVSAASVIKDEANGAFKGCTNYIGDMSNSGVGIAPYHDLDSKVPADLKAEIEDRYGHSPDEVHNAFAIMSLRIRAKRHSMDRIDVGGGRVAVEFKDVTQISPRVFTILGRRNRECYLSRTSFVWPYSGDPIRAVEAMMDAFESALREIEEARASLGV
jgi:basic membrane lipoprotein Med (substrate-binding protein (PBP1-ABC) superfamily)